MTREDPNKSALIISGAFKVLLKEGLPHLSYDRVAQAAGVTRQLVRYYFPTPEDLMMTLCEQMADTYREAMINGITHHEGQDRLDVFFDFYFDVLDGTPKPRDDQAYDALLSLSAGSDRLRNTLRDQYTLLGQVVSHELRLQYPDLPLPACTEISYLFVVIMYGHWKMVASLGLSESHRLVSRRAIDRLIASYRSVPETIDDAQVWKAEV
ncbi:MAG: TetR/AcrR family transcriptional regulator [Tateyamaria sp.]|uniref:TetR/AcrR family transcriptional regulator n=1 Tax=Tateyamaria sp. TaxID=1929288 RepID=UPI0032851790